jgi:hypothetical protein
MNRFLTPLLLLGIAVYAGWYNANHADRQLLVPGIEMLDPSGAGDPHALGIFSVKVLFGLAALALAWGVFGLARDRSRPRKE